MAKDVRQVIAGVLTFSLFIMLGNMIKRDHIDLIVMEVPATSTVTYDLLKVLKQSLVKLSEVNDGPWIEHGKALKPCWNKTSQKGIKQSKGFIMFSLTAGPEYHFSQISNAIAVARYLGAALVLPDIKGSNPAERRSFGEIYDVEKFQKSLAGVVLVVKNQPAGVSREKSTVRMVPNVVSKDYIAKNIRPLFKKRAQICNL